MSAGARTNRQKIGQTLAQFASDAATAFFRSRDQARRRGTAPANPPLTTAPARTTPAKTPAAAYPGDFDGLPALSYAPWPDQAADPGEVVWAWVPYEEDHNQGKDRPVLVVGHDGSWLLGLPLSSVDHDLDARQEAAQGRFWVSLGRGAWDVKGRESFVRADRIVRLDPKRVRRIGGQVSEAIFWTVADELRRHWGD